MGETDQLGHRVVQVADTGDHVPDGVGGDVTAKSVGADQVAVAGASGA
ncbi:MAG: hypothetical protein ACRDP7_47320 [Trebonia sp.]